MAINISDQFNVNLALPIDSRIVAANATARGNITFKYNGLQVFDLSDRKTYVWNSSTNSWSPADVSGTGDVDRVSKWSSSSGLTSSCLYVGTSIYGNSQGRIGINSSLLQGTFQIIPPGGGSQPVLISNVSSSNFIASNYYYSGTDQAFSLTNGSGAIKFRSNGEVFIYARSYNQPGFSAAALGLSSDNITASGLICRFVPDGNGFTGWVEFTRPLNIGGNVRISTNTTVGSATTPDFTFQSDAQTGIYRPSSGTIGFSTAGTQKMILNSSGLLISSSGNVTSPSSRLHIDGGNGVATYMQITNGTTTGTGANTGLLVGLSSTGYPYFISRPQTTEYPSGNPMLFAFGTSGAIRYRLSPHQISIYSNPNGQTFADVNGGANITGGIGSRVVLGSNSISGSGTLTVGTLFVPNNSIVAIEATFVTYVGGNFLSRKIYSMYSVGSGGTISVQNSGLTTISGYSSPGILAQASSPSTNNITNGGSFVITTSNQIRMTVGVSTSASSVVSYTATICDF